MAQTSLKQRLLLIIFGVFLSLVFLEIGLRIAGGVVLYLQERHNQVSFNPNEYRILCLGESTTALGNEDSYPSQLQKLLNEQSKQKRFAVINKGIVSTTTNYIVAHLDENLDMYKPQLVIVMMGINDKAYISDYHKILWLEDIKACLEGLRVYKLGYLLYEHINHHYYWGYIDLAQWYGERKYYTLAQEYLNRAIECGPDIDKAYVEWGLLLDDQGLYGREEALYLKEIALRPQSPLFYRALGQLYHEQGKETLSKEYYQKSAQLGMANYLPVTLLNYRLLLDKILSRHIKVIVMQYPLRDIGPLKSYIGQRNGVTFVENRKNFWQAMSHGGYDRYFMDHFGRDFGHCTAAGNRLIASNLTEVILNQ